MKRYAIFGVAILIVALLSVIPAFSQEDAKSGKAETAPAAAPVPAPEAAKTGDLSIYGEIQAVNVSTSSMTVQYYDYDNDEEKSVEIVVDKDTKLENVKAIDEIKKGDWVDVTYASVGGKNTAKMVSVEKEEPAMQESAPATAEE
jgi:hypothetical protein